MGILRRSAALLRVLVLKGAAVMLIGLGAGQPWKMSLALSVLQGENKQHRKHQSMAQTNRLAKDTSFFMSPAGLAEFIDFNGVIPACLAEITAH